jgi:hypothetical protein
MLQNICSDVEICFTGIIVSGNVLPRLARARGPYRMFGYDGAGPSHLLRLDDSNIWEIDAGTQVLHVNTNAICVIYLHYSVLFTIA